MIPQIGDIYCVYSKQLQQYTACQVTDYEEDESGGTGLLAAVLTLDWTGKELPDTDQLYRMKPLICNYYFWNDKLDHSYVKAQVPNGYMYVGNIPPLTTQKTNSYGGGWSNGNSVYRQHQWEQIDPALRRKFKEAADDYSEVEIGGVPVLRRTHRLSESFLEGLQDWSELKKLPCLTEIHTNRYDEELLAYLLSNPFRIRLSLSGEYPSVLDLSSTHISDLSIHHVNHLKKLMVNQNTTQLNLSGNPSARWTITAPDQGQGMTLSVNNPDILFCFKGLEQLESLYINNIEQLDIRQLVRRFPHLKQLWLQGKPGMLHHVNSLQQLTDLSSFSTHDLFGFTGKEFPTPDQLHHLSRLWLSSLPADAARHIQKIYKVRVPLGLDLSVTKPRKPEWLEENVDNPFRDWEGRESITAAHARKAAQLYKKVLRGIRKLDMEAEDASILEQLTVMVTDYTMTFNKMDQRKRFIETIECEEIDTILQQLLDQAEQRLNEHNKSKAMNREQLNALFDELRDF